MTSGVPVVHSAIEGSDELFGSNPPLRFFADVDEAIAVVRDLLALPPSELDAIAAEARALAFSRFTILNGLRYMIQVLESSRCVSLGVKVDSPKNPWLSLEQL